MTHDDWRNPAVQNARKPRYDWALAKRMWDEMRPGSEIIAALGCNKSVLYRMIRRHGWRERPRIMPVMPPKEKPVRVRRAVARHVKPRICQNYRCDNPCGGEFHVAIAGVDLCAHCYGVVLAIANDSDVRPSEAA